jgi:antitoxin HicB
MLYKIKLTPDDNGTLMVTCPAFPEVSTFGEDTADAIKHARDAIEEAIAARIADGQPIPGPNKVAGKGEALVALPTMVVLKTELYKAMKDAAITRADMMRKLKWNRESVDRLFRLSHASKLDQMEAAFGALWRKLEVTTKPQATTRQ